MTLTPHQEIILDACHRKAHAEDRSFPETHVGSLGTLNRLRAKGMLTHVRTLYGPRGGETKVYALTPAAVEWATRRFHRFAKAAEALDLPEGYRVEVTPKIARLYRPGGVNPISQSRPADVGALVLTAEGDALDREVLTNNNPKEYP